jgi:hypothetical protein
MVHAMPVILATWEAEIRGIMVGVQPRQKRSQTPSQPMPGHSGTCCMPVILAANGSINRRLMVQAGLGKEQDPICKITRAKRAGGMAQV